MLDDLMARVYNSGHEADLPKLKWMVWYVREQRGVGEGQY